MLTGSTLVPFYWNHTIPPIQIRQTPVLVAAFQCVNNGVTPVVLQLHSGNPLVGQVPLFALYIPAGGFTLLDTTHLGGDGIAAENMWLALSATMTNYAVVGPVSGFTQLMIR